MNIMAMFDYHLMFATVVLALLVPEISAVGQEDCPQGTTLLTISNTDCFALVDLAEGAVQYTEARQKCQSGFTDGKLVHIATKYALGKIMTWAIEQGLPTDSQAGFWTGWIRNQAAPLEPNGTLSQTNKEVRRNRSSFRLTWSPFHFAPDRVWRNNTQPGNTLDERDEQCTAQSRPGKQPEYEGIDDYECNGAQLHYTICQVPMDLGPDEGFNDYDK